MTGREERYDGFEGEPKSVGGALSGNADQYMTTGTTGTGLTGSTGHHHGHHGSSNTGGQSTLQKVEAKLDPRVDSNNDGRAGVGR